MFYVLFAAAVLPQAAGRPELTGATGTLRAHVIAPDGSAVEQKLVRRRWRPLGEDHGARKLAEINEDGNLFLQSDQDALVENPTACARGQVAYAVLSDGALAVIDMGPHTPSGTTEVRRLTSNSQYANYMEDNPVSTNLALTASAANNGDWAFLSDGEDNLVGINSGMTASNMTEVHRLKYAGDKPWQSVDVDVVTALPHPSTFDEWEFLLDSESNLVVIKKGPDTPSSMTEIQKLTSSSGYQEFATEEPLVTALPKSASTSNDGDWTFLMDGLDNLICIRRPSPRKHNIEIKRLTARSNYSIFDLEDGSATLPHELHNPIPSGDGSAVPPPDVHWVFEMDAGDDILCIKEGPTTLHGYTEIHKLSKASKYANFTMTQEATGAPCRVPHFTGEASIR